MKCNLNPTNYINTTEPVMWNVSGHTRTKPVAHNFTHTGKVINPEENRPDITALVDWAYNTNLLILTRGEKVGLAG